MNRRPLPNRRPTETINVTWDAHDFAVTVGYDDEGRASEVFANHAKGAMAHVLSDACVLISIALQYGVQPEALAKSLGRVPGFTNGAEVDGHASPIGAIIACIIGGEHV